MQEFSKHFFLELLAENGRLIMMDTILSTFGRVMSAHRGEVLCEVTTAKLLDYNGKVELNKVLQSLVTPGKKINVLYKTNPSLLAGMTLSVGDYFIDMSTVSKISSYAKALEAAL
ncbi:unnamed protein product [Soboliphyme baturini]|uniref:ATP synthase subunit O, mitochondrial n=1 Tax=Soboliphyme baturini TaxID=241478 RepID=A0A183I9V5_9BILA|nr:unnamed protein product [Soboliphyme baturini]